MFTWLYIMVTSLDCSDTVPSEEMRKDGLALERTLIDQRCFIAVYLSKEYLLLNAIH